MYKRYKTLMFLIMLTGILLATGCAPKAFPPPQAPAATEAPPVVEEVVKTVEVAAPAALPYISVPTPFTEFMTVVAADVVDVRSGPGDTFTSYG